MKKILVAPSILSADFTKINDEIKSIELAGADLVHCDVMDGVFAPNLSFGVKMVADIRKITSLPLDVHLMIVEPQNFIEKFINVGADIISFHIEAVSLEQAQKNLEFIRSKNTKAGIVISPDTDVALVKPLLPLCDTITLMCVYPGFSGQKFLPKSYERAMQLNSLIKDSNINFEIDGGATPENIAQIKQCGANIIVAGNAFFGSNDRKSIVHSLKTL